jgi:hypothetical protein
MHSTFLAVAATITMTALSAPAHGQVMNSTSGNPRPFDVANNHDSLMPAVAREPRRLNLSETNQVRRWGDVGQCVARADRVTSISYVAAEPGSSEAGIAAKRLEPRFASCLARTHLRTPRNPALRRAALADALGVTTEE